MNRPKSKYYVFQLNANNIKVMRKFPDKTKAQCFCYGLNFAQFWNSNLIQINDGSMNDFPSSIYLTQTQFTISPRALSEQPSQRQFIYLFSKTKKKEKTNRSFIFTAKSFVA